MKKLVKSALALATILFASACMQENLEPAQTGSTVTFSVEVPEAVATKALSENGENLNNLVYAVYKTDAANLEQAQNLMGENMRVYQVSEATAFVGGKTNVTLELINDQNYIVLFWAQVDNTWVGENSDLTNITYPSDLVANNDKYSAFSGVAFVEKVDGARAETVTLTRPFAQINIAAADPVRYDVNVTASRVTVINAGAKFNVATQLASDEIDVVYGEAAIPGDGFNGYDHYVAMNYVFATGNVKVAYEIFTDHGTISTYDAPIENVPVAKNYRTNIVGNLLTSNVDYNVELDQEWGDKEFGSKYGEIDGKKYIAVENTEEFNTAFAAEDVDIIILAKNIALSADAALTVENGKDLTIDLNSKIISSTSTKIGQNYNMFDVRGTLAVKNGTMEYKHLGENMGWNSSTNIFNITAGGVLNLDGVTAKNLGGSDMGFVAHLNNWGEVTLNVENCTLESNYVPVRVFNSGYDMNNITIKNSTLNGKYCFWVHNYKGAGDSAGTDATLNLDICNGTNTFVYTGKAPILYGFNNPLYYDANGAEVVFDAETLAARLTSDVENIAIALGNDIDLPIASLGQQTGGSGEYKLGGENTKNITVDLNDNKLNITTTYWSVLGAKNDDAVFTIKNGTMTSSQASGTWNSYDLCFANCNYVIEDVDFEKAIALEGKSFTLNDVTVKETHDYYAIWVSAKGQTINIDGLTVESAGRGIKIDEQYVSAPAKVVLNLNDAKFKTVKKAAVVVKSVAGAEINASDLDITEVAEDTKFAVWVDEDSKAYADKVVVNGAYVKIEGTQGVVVESAENLPSEIEENAAVYVAAGTYTFPTNVGAGATIVCEEGTVFKGTSSLNINGATVVGATFKNDGGQAVSGTLYGTLKNCTFEGAETLRWCYTNADKPVVFENCVIKTTLRGVHFDGMDGDVIFKNCEINGFNAYSGTGTITFENCSFGHDNSKYNGLNIYSNTLLKNCEFNYVSGNTNFIDMEGTGKTLTIENCTATLDGAAADVSDFVGGSKIDENTVIIK